METLTANLKATYKSKLVIKSIDDRIKFRKEIKRDFKNDAKNNLIQFFKEMGLNGTIINTDSNVDWFIALDDKSLVKLMK